MELHIEAQHTDLDPSMHEWVTHRMEELNTPHEDILHARVTLVHNTHHQQGSEEARISLTLPGKILNTVRTGKTLTDALYDAMDVINRTLYDFRAERQQTIKTPGPRPRGRVLRLFPDRGYGFIETESHREVYFHANAVHGIPFEKLVVGMSVDLDITDGHNGPQASRVTPHNVT